MLCEVLLPLSENAVLKYWIKNQWLRIMNAYTDEQELNKDNMLKIGMRMKTVVL